MLAARVLGVGLLGPGLADWGTGAAVLAGDTPYRSAPTVLPLPALLPAAERRRAGRVVRLALAAGLEALAHSGSDARGLPSVFTSSGGDGDNCHEICQTLAGPERLISPTRFHNSVHNAAAGYWGIAQHCMQPSTALCAYDASFGAGLLEALAQLAEGAGPILLVSYDLDYPAPLQALRPIPDALAIALVLGRPESGGGALLGVRLADEAATALPDAMLEALRVAIPAARGLPLLRALATGAAHCVLDYLPEARLHVQLQP